MRTRIVAEGNAFYEIDETAPGKNKRRGETRFPVRKAAIPAGRETPDL